jgi:hypothetical protein
VHRPQRLMHDVAVEAAMPEVQHRMDAGSHLRIVAGWPAQAAAAAGGKGGACKEQWEQVRACKV